VLAYDRLPSPVRLVAGVDVAYDDTSGRAFSAVVVIDVQTLRRIETAVAQGMASFPYVPGLFSFREIPVIAPALAKLRSTPDIVICDGQGIAHPRRFGLASHLGVLYDVPAIGCAKTRLVGEAEEPGPTRGDRARLKIDGEVVGAVLRTQRGVKPVYVSQGHRVSLDTACEWVLKTASCFRLPEPVRAANQVVNEMRAVARRGG
jgi:deoxyribonuclease V